MGESCSIAVRLFDKSRATLEREIGHGSFGKVYIGTISNTNLPQVAIKIFFKEIRNRGKISLADKEKAYEELFKLAVIDHENIVKLYGVVEDDMPWLVFEYMKDGNLLEYVQNTAAVKERTLTKFCRDICNGMVFLHSNNILHKDLAARNILLCNQTAKIADLGLSTFLKNDDEGIYTLNGKLFPFRHAAVECIVEQLFTFESDVWSFGVLMYEIFSRGLTPYGQESKEADVRRFIVDHVTPLNIYTPHCSEKIYSVMNSILSPFREERPSFADLHSEFEAQLTGLIKKFATFRKRQSNIENISGAVSTFHKIKSKGLSSSFNNLNVLSTFKPSPVMGEVQTLRSKDGLLTVMCNEYSSRSSSTPDIMDELASEDMKNARRKSTVAVEGVNGHGRDRSQHRNIMYPTTNVIAQSHFEQQMGRRYSADQLGKVPLAPKFIGDSHHEQEQNPQFLHNEDLSSSPTATSKHLENYNEQQSRVEPTSNAANPMLNGFVYNRFSKRKQ